MSVDAAGKKWYSTSDPIFIGNKRISEIWVGHKKVYPDTYPINFAMYCRFDQYVISKYSDTPVNEYGCRLYIDEEHSEYRYTDVEKVAFVWTYDENNKKWRRYIYVRFNDNVDIPDESRYVLYDPYIADYGNIIGDGVTTSGISNHPLYRATKDGIRYYYRGPVNANLEDKDGNLLTKFATSVSTDNTRLFDNPDDARAYILS